MRLCYVLLSPTWGMHQYTAGLANCMAAAGHEVHLVTTCHAPLDRYAPEVTIHTPVSTTNTGFSLEGVRLSPPAILRSSRVIRQLDPDLAHLTGPHLSNPILLGALKRAGVPTVHTIHDLHPHAGARYGRLLYSWNAWVRRRSDHLLVHGQRYRRELIAQGVDPARITCTLLTHLFLGYAAQEALAQSPPEICYEPWALFLGRLEVYKGLGVLVEAARLLDQDPLAPTGVGPAPVAEGLVLAGSGRLDRLVQGGLPASVEVRNRLIGDDEALDLFRRCSLVVLPYVEASQSAQVAAAYCFRKPVIVTDVGALPEYVREGETGWVVPAGDPLALAAALREALADPGRLARMGQSSLEHYQQWRQERESALQAMYVRLQRT